MLLLSLLNLWYIIFLEFTFHYRKICSKMSEIITFTKNSHFCPSALQCFCLLAVPPINSHLMQSVWLSTALASYQL